MKSQNRFAEKRDNRLYFTELFGVVLWFRRKRTNDCRDVKRRAEKLGLQGNKAASEFPERAGIAKGKWKDELLKRAKCQLDKNEKML